MKKALYKYIIFALITLMTAVLASCTDNSSEHIGDDFTQADTSFEAPAEETSAVEVNAYPVIPEYPENGAEVSLANQKIRGLFENYQICGTNRYIGLGNQYYPVPVMFRWSHERTPDKCTLLVSENSDMSEPLSFEVTPGKQTFNVYDLFRATTYYWQVVEEYPDVVSESEIFSFTTQDIVRTVRINGVSNTRDIGGWKISGGTRVKQGMIYRGAQPDAITQSGKTEMLEDLGIKTVIDLRAPGEGTAGTSAQFGDKINYFNCPIATYSQITSQKREVLVEVFKILADPDNYPIYFHCAVGRDRTGTLALLINGLLGVSREDIIKDYELFALSESAGVPWITVPDYVNGEIIPLYNKIMEFAPNSKPTFQNAVELFLRKCGVSRDEIDSIRNIMTQK